MPKDKLSLIIPTVNRIEYISRLLESVRRQSLFPQELLIIDSGPLDISPILRKYGDMNIRYIISRPPSLTRQRNIGITNLSESTTLVGFVDDDIVFEEKSLENMLKFWETETPDTAGASFNNIYYNYRSPNIFEHIFLVSSSQRGKLLKSGFNSPLLSIDSNRGVNWLFGGITVWRRKVVEEFKFDEWFTGNAFCDDVDYSYRVGKKYKLMVVKNAKVIHLTSQIDYNKEFIFGKTVIMNRVYFVRKNREFSLVLCYWACLGVCMGNLLKGILKYDSGLLRRACGNFIGLCESVSVGRNKC